MAKPQEEPIKTTSNKSPTSKFFTLPRELRQSLLHQTFHLTSTPFRAYYRIDVIDELIDRFAAMRTWSTNLRRVHPLFNADIDFVVTRWEGDYRKLLADFTNALVGSDSCWLSKFEEGLPVLSFEAVVEVSSWAVRPPVFGWERGVETMAGVGGRVGVGAGRYVVYEHCLARWKMAGWTKGDKLRTMKQRQRVRGGTISVPSTRRYCSVVPRVEEEGEGNFFRAPLVKQDGKKVDGEEVDGEEVDGEEVDGGGIDGEEVDREEIIGEEVHGEEISEVGREATLAQSKARMVKIKGTGLARLVTKAGDVFRTK